MPGQVQTTDPRTQVVRQATDAAAPDSLDPRVSLIFSRLTVGIGCYEFIHNTLRQRFQTFVQVPESLATLYDNDPENPPEDTIFARFSVQHTSATTKTTGGQAQLHRKTGDALIRLMAPLGIGDSGLLAVADAIDAAFLGVTSQLIYGTPAVEIVGAEDRYWVIEVRAPWRYDERALPSPSGGGWELPNFETLYNNVRTRFETLVETAESVVTIYDNDPQDPPENTLHVRAAVRTGLSFRAENGGAAGRHRFRTPGVLMAAIRAPLGQGDRAILQLADVINVAFRAITASGVTYQTPRVENKGRQDDERWWLVTVTCPFYADEIA